MVTNSSFTSQVTTCHYLHNLLINLWLAYCSASKPCLLNSHGNSCNKHSALQHIFKLQGTETVRHPSQLHSSKFKKTHCGWWTHR